MTNNTINTPIIGGWVPATTSALPGTFPPFQPTNPFQPKPTTQNHDYFTVPESYGIVEAGTNKTHATLILDASGSMASFINDTIGGVNTFISKQADDNDGTTISVVKFEGNAVKTIVDTKLAAKELTISSNDYFAAGMTNLLDAIGQTVLDINNKLKSISLEERPNIILQIMTDGHENASKEYRHPQIKAMLTECENKGWIVTFLGANVDSFNVAQNLGINAAAVSNYSMAKTSSTFDTVSSSVTRMKTLRNQGFNNSMIYGSAAVFTDEERKDIV